MAGGRGERFWPQSRRHMPKQFLKLVHPDKSMLQMTVERILPLVEPASMFIATGEAYRPIVQAQLPELPARNILCEPVARNTAPCIGLGAEHIARRCGEDAVMLVLPSDHLIKDSDGFLRILEAACAQARASDSLITIGIKPNAPETGYGYIKCAAPSDGGVRRAERFVEKPDIDAARRYLESGEYLWNSGMFVWKVSTILDGIRACMPEMYEGLSAIGRAIDTPSERETLEREFGRLQSISIDYGVMEKSDNILALTGDFGWDDVGSWNAVGRLSAADEAGNAIEGNVVTVDTHNSIIRGGKRLIAAVGLSDVVIVETEDALLVCDKSQTGRIKEVISRLKQAGDEAFL